MGREWCGFGGAGVALGLVTGNIQGVCLTELQSVEFDPFWFGGFRIII